VKSEENFIDGRKRWMAKLEMPLILSGGLILLAAVAYGVGDAIFTPTSIPQQPGFVDIVVGSRSVIAAIRVAVIFAAAFFVVSVVGLTARRQWLIRVGPVEVSERVSDLRSESRRLEESLEKAEETIDILRYKLMKSNFVLGKAVVTKRGSE
jgi:hypothetical protein